MLDADRISLSVSEDGLEAWAEIGAGPPLAPEALGEQVRAFGITHGLDPVVLESLAHALELEAALAGRHRIAQGRAPEPGAPPRVELALPPVSTAGSDRDDGSFDYRVLNVLVPVARDERIGMLHAATPGKPGIDVRGEALAAPAIESLEWCHGEGIAVLEDGAIVATRTGARTVDRDGTVDVVELHVHAGSVDLASGHLETGGSLSIGRDVSLGMSVRADHEISIGGTVDGATVCALGSIEIRGGAIGRDSGQLVAGANVSVRHALSIRIQAGDRIFVQRSVSGCRLVARSVVVEGRMLGDSIEAESLIRVGEAGSPAGGPCWLRAAVPPDAPAPVNVPSATRSGLRAGRDTLRQRSSPRGRTRGGRRPGPGSAKGGSRADSRYEELLDWRTRQRQLQQSARIEIVGTAHPGCRIDFGGPPLTLESPVQGAVFQIAPDTGRIIQSEL